MFDDEIMARATELLALCRTRKATLATVESCTGGLISGALTAVARSSDGVLGGLVTYANEAKTELARVQPELLRSHGAVSPEVARAMAEGGRERLGATIALAVTGVAGPAGGTEQKPVGLVHFGCAVRGQATRHEEQRFGALSRDEIRRLTVLHALDLGLRAAGALD